ncbi:3'-5' exonuclease [Salisediminibacterium beveridgei]|uniref:DNA polymerase III, alpha subunit, Gram-positive type n=1 Tax=Salisediminibacterium beveridgei TaxID=632773 RepID=A0A1D7QVJ1_9BACI|nr:exonuclease domain-containing protein [Salisediminibacterium beveridgei]AOM83036.1 DNA polymerase III, alpha subunit, Gram-positive type [Salisediminibacterium beveridgei]
MKVSSWQIIKYFGYDFHKFHANRQRWSWKHWDYMSQVNKQLKEFRNLTLYDDEPLDNITFTVFDLETTGFFCNLGDEILAIGATKFNRNRIGFPEQFYEIIEPVKPMSDFVSKLTGLTHHEVKGGLAFPEGFSKFMSFTEGTVLVAHPASFDVQFLQMMTEKWRLKSYHPLAIDQFQLAKSLFPDQRNSLDDLIKQFEIETSSRHHALADAYMTAKVFDNLLDILHEQDLTTWGDLKKFGKM